MPVVGRTGPILSKKLLEVYTDSAIVGRTGPILFKEAFERIYTDSAHRGHSRTHTSESVTDLFTPIWRG